MTLRQCAPLCSACLRQWNVKTNWTVINASKSLRHYLQQLGGWRCMWRMDVGLWEYILKLSVYKLFTCGVCLWIYVCMLVSIYSIYSIYMCVCVCVCLSVYLFCQSVLVHLSIGKIQSSRGAENHHTWHLFHLSIKTSTDNMRQSISSSTTQSNHTWHLFHLLINQATINQYIINDKSCNSILKLNLQLNI